jgi:predicted deacetylase
MKSYINNNTGILIRIDDVCENMDWELMRKLELLFDNYSIKPVLGVIPNNKDKEFLSFPRNNNFWEQVRKWQDKGWEIVQHGYTHIYDKLCEKKSDYFNYGGGSEFFGHSLEIQEERIKNGLEKFKKEKINVRSFFAPNQTYDDNTFTALKNCGIKEVIDGYGLMPYTEKNIKFIPQLFEKVILLPFGIQSTKLHLHVWTEADYNSFENFIKKNSNRILCYDEALKKVNDNLFYRMLRFFTSKILKFKRIGLDKVSGYKIKTP